MANTDTALLSFKDVSVHYGAIQAIHGVTFDVQKGQIVTLIGANGAGKTTTLRAVSGLVRPTPGDITHAGTSLVGMPAHLIVRRRVCQARKDADLPQSDS